MKKLLITILLAAALLALGGCGTGADPNCGVYEARTAVMDGSVVAVKSIFQDGFSIELKKHGKAALHIEGDDYNLQWEKNGDEIRIIAADMEFSGTVSEGVMVLRDFNGSGIDFKLVCEELLQKTELSKYWNGRWFGWQIIYSGWGEYADAEDMASDVVAEIAMDGDTGTINIWYFGGAEEELILSADVRFEEGSTEYGKMVAVSGSAFSFELSEGDFSIDPGESTVRSLDHMIDITGKVTDPEHQENGFEYHIFMRPWGMTWDDVEKAESEDFLYPDMMPSDYDLYLVQIGVLDAVPDTEDFEDFEDEEEFDLEGFDLE